MLGDTNDIAARLRVLLPSRWFPDRTPVLDALLGCLATPWSWLYGLIQYTSQQSRLATATGDWLDLIAFDFFGLSLSRSTGESDSAYRSRIQWALFQPAATRQAVSLALEHITGFAPEIFEPGNCADTGSYGLGILADGQPAPGMAYGMVGGWGNLDLPYQVFIRARRPVIEGVSSLSGYGVGAGGYGLGLLGYVDLQLLPGAITDSDINEAVKAVLPANAVAWLQIT